jgi:heat shock protein HtpX
MTVYNIISYNKLRSVFLMIIFIIFFTSVFYLIGLSIGNSQLYLVLGLLISLISSLSSYFYSDKLILFSTKAIKADKRKYFNYYTVVENLTIAEGMPMPKVYVIDDNSMNAFATGRNPKNSIICVTTGLLSKLNRKEIEGVVAHELSHIKNYDILLSSMVSVLVGALVFVTDMLSRRWLFGGFSSDNDNRNSNIFNLILILVVIIVTPLTATLIQLAISRKREFLADASGALITRYPKGLANALEKISNDNIALKNYSGATAHLFISNPFKNNTLKSKFSNLFSTHPLINERIKILRSM